MVVGIVYWAAWTAVGTVNVWSAVTMKVRKQITAVRRSWSFIVLGGLYELCS